MKPSVFLQDFVGLLFPEVCLSCGQALYKGEDQLCMHCIFQLPKTNFHKDPMNEVRIKFIGKIELEHAFTYLRFTKKGNVQKILHQIKYRNKPELAKKMGKWFGRDLKEDDFDSKFDLIIPIPLHKSRLRKRGYNQSDYFARGISEALNVPWSSAVVKRKIKSGTQTRKSRVDRWENVANIFEVVDQDKIFGQRILLVDDVITSGATLEACGMQLIQNNCKSLSIATIASA